MPGVRYNVRDVSTGLWLVAPISAWGHRCSAETTAWTDIREASMRFTTDEAEDQVNFLGWNLKLKAEKKRVPRPYRKPDDSGIETNEDKA